MNWAEIITDPSDRDGAERPVEGAVVDLEQTVIYVARESMPVRECVTDRAGAVALARQRLPCLLHPATRIVEDRPGLILANRAADVGWLTANLFLDGVQRSDTVETFCCDRRPMCDVDVVELRGYRFGAGHDDGVGGVVCLE
jgi:hypothetical protein